MALHQDGGKWAADRSGGATPLSNIGGFEVDSVTANPFNISTTANSSHIMNTNCMGTFSSKNPNYYTYRGFFLRNIQDYVLYFDDMKTWIIYKGKNISYTEIKPSFQLNPNEKGLVHVNFSVSSKDMDSAAATSIVKDWSRGVVEFNVNVKGVVTGYNLHTIDVLEKRSIRVSRKEIKVGFSLNLTTGSMLDGLRKCNIAFSN
ncbi:hypothetical protein Q3G72_017084 [Acer saccharum]|nr:hypothetical protein Q3G72_017084 [Acer saccharum]